MTNSGKRTNKCELITREMSWQEILIEARKIEDDFEAQRSLSIEERILIGGALFAENRQKIIDSLPKNLSEKEFKKQLYFQTYGEHLPEDFFDKK